MKKVYIEYPFVEGPWGGGNQFLKAIRDIWRMNGIYSENVDEADIILLNSTQAYYSWRKICRCRLKFPDKLFVNRIDGPIFLIRNANKSIDYGVGVINEYLCEASIFQTEWNKLRCAEYGIKDNKPSVVICNGSNRKIFYPNRGIHLFGEDKINVIATSWSSNWNKGFDYYQFLDENIDKDKYRFIFVGNSPVKFKYAIHIPATDSHQLAQYLQSSDIYVTASRRDPCSNSLIEALNTGLPAAVYNDGGHPFILKNGGECFESKEDMLNKIYRIASSLDEYRKTLPVYDIENIAKQYYEFMCEQYNAQKKCLVDRTSLRKEYRVFKKKINNAYMRLELCALYGKVEKYLRMVKGDA